MDIFGMHISDKIYMPIIIVVSFLLIDLVINAILNSKITIHKKNLSKHAQRSRETVLILAKNTIRVILIIIAIVAILQVLGVNTATLVTGVGAVTVVIGLAFQDVLKDFLVGAAIIMESQYAIGEIVEINGFKGEVIALNLRSTRLKSMTGEVRIIANRTISEVTNYSLDSILLKVLVSVSYEDNIEKVEKVLSSLIKKLNKEIEELKSEITIQGVDSLSSSSVDFLLTMQTSAKTQYIVKRKILREVKLTFDKNNIKIPYTQIEVHNDK